uniref:Uncharacterized protein n=1 Tax=Alexandrium catenella TaxID=2925 RepID=A0A7S1LT75_ALECA
MVDESAASLLQTRRSQTGTGTGSIICLLIMMVLLCGALLLVTMIRRRNASLAETRWIERWQKEVEETPEGGCHFEKHHHDEVMMPSSMVNGLQVSSHFRYGRMPPAAMQQPPMADGWARVAKAADDKPWPGFAQRADAISNDLFVASINRKSPGSDDSICTPTFQPGLSRENLAEPMSPPVAANVRPGSVRQLSSRALAAGKLSPFGEPFRADDEEVVQFSPQQPFPAPVRKGSPMARGRPDY